MMALTVMEKRAYIHTYLTNDDEVMVIELSNETEPPISPPDVELPEKPPQEV